MGTARMAQPTCEQLLGIMVAKDRQIAQLVAGIHKLEAENAGLRSRVTHFEPLLEKATREGKRRAAPFSKGLPEKNPKKPGRKSGKNYGPKAHRLQPEQEPDEIINLPLPAQCGECGGAVDGDHIDQQFQMENPRRPIVRRFDIHVGQYRPCGKRFRPRHAL